MKQLAVGIENYVYESAEGLAVLRAVQRLRRQALASSVTELLICTCEPRPGKGWKVMAVL